MRLLLTSDWQLGLSIRQLGERAAEARDERFSSACRAMEIAQERDVDFVLLAGDTFDSSDVDNLVIERALEAIEAAGDRPVFVLPGNHDPLDSGAVWHRRAWGRAPANVRVLGEAVEIELEGDGALYPCPLKQKRSRRDPTEWIPPRVEGDSRIRIGFAHGSFGIVPTKANFPIAADRCERSGLDLLALGDWHGLVQTDRAAYAGTPEATGFSERDAGNVLVVELESWGAEPKMEPVRVGRFEWSERSARIERAAEIADLRDELYDLEHAEDRLLRARLKLEPGALLESREELEDLRRGLEDRFFHLSWAVEEAPTWEDDLPLGLARRLDQELDSLLEDGSAPEADRRVAQGARTLLRTLVAQASEGNAERP